MDFAVFMERYGYKLLTVVFIGTALLLIPLWLGYAMVSHGFYSKDEAAFVVALMVFAAVAAAYAGKFMNTSTSILSRLGYHTKAKLLEDEKRLEDEKEKLREEGGKLY